MTAEASKIEAYLSQVLAGSLVGQLAARHNLTLEDITKGDISYLATEIVEVGISPQLLAEHVMSALFTLFMEERNADTFVHGVTDLLWTIMGDPKNGGSPPEIYRRAGIGVHLLLLGLLDSDFPSTLPRS